MLPCSLMVMITDHREWMVSWGAVIRVLITWIVWSYFKYTDSWSRTSSSSKLHMAWLSGRIVHNDTWSTCKLLLLLLKLTTIITWILLKLMPLTQTLTHITNRLCTSGSLYLILIRLGLTGSKLWLLRMINILLAFLKLLSHDILITTLLLLAYCLSAHLSCLKL